MHWEDRLSTGWLLALLTAVTVAGLAIGYLLSRLQDVSY
jgi:hypothetical protein